MTDEELITFAAQAVGIEVNVDRARADWSWNPLDDDGTAFRLAVNLGLQMYFFIPNDNIGVAYTEVSRGVKERLGVDPHAATRRAIVRAAANIGRGK